VTPKISLPTAIVVVAIVAGSVALSITGHAIPPWLLALGSTVAGIFPALLSPAAPAKAQS